MKRLLRSLALIPLACVAGLLQAQTFPSLKPVTLIVPWSPGGTTDIALRALAEATSRTLGQRMLIENKPGGSGAMGATIVAIAKPDGYLLTQLPMGVFRLPFMTKTSFDPIKDLTWVLNVAGYEFAILVRADAPWKTWDEFVAYAKANPGKIFHSTNGPGTSPAITMEDLGKRIGVKWDPVPYKSTADGLTALRGNQIQAHVGSPPWAMVKNGDVRPLITWGPVRSPKSPDVPTLKERYGIVSNSPWGIGGAPGLDAKVVKVLHDAFRKAMDDPALQKSFDAVNMELYYMGTDEYLKWARATYAQEKTTAERLGLKP